MGKIKIQNSIIITILIFIFLLNCCNLTPEAYNGSHLTFALKSKENYSDVNTDPSDDATEAKNFKKSFDNTFEWNQTTIELNKTLILPSSTRIIIESSILSFLALNDDPVGLSIGENSSLEIFNSLIYLNPNSTNFGFVNFHGFSFTMKNSSIKGLTPPGFRYSSFSVTNADIFIENCTFADCYESFQFDRCNKVLFNKCKFLNSGILAIRGQNSNEISILNCLFQYSYYNDVKVTNSERVCIMSCRLNHQKTNNTQFEKQQDYSLFFDFVPNIFIKNNTFKHIGAGVYIKTEAGELIGNTSLGRTSFLNVSILENIFNHCTGKGIYGYCLTDRYNTVYYRIIINENCFTEIGDIAIHYVGTEITVERNNITRAKGGIFLDDSDPFQEHFHSIKSNRIQDINEFGIKHSSSSNPKQFEIIENTIINSTGVGIHFHGIVGGSREPSLVIGNIINYTAKEAIMGTNIHSRYLYFTGKLVNTLFYRNAFIDCIGGFIKFQDKYYYCQDIRWDNGMWGNYWGDACHGTDEDQNEVQDNFHVISTDFGWVDEAPLLSLDLVTQDCLMSSHPRDLSIIELDLHNTKLSWNISTPNRVNISVLVNSHPLEFQDYKTNVTISLEEFPRGKNNVTLVLQSLVDSTIYRDLVWVQVIPWDFFQNIIAPLLPALFSLVVLIGASLFLKRWLKGIQGQ